MLQFFKFDFLKTVKSPEQRKAWFVAILADAIQIVGMPLFAEGGLSPLDTGLDVIVGAILHQAAGMALGLSAYLCRGACPRSRPFPHLDGSSVLCHAPVEQRT